MDNNFVIGVIIPLQAARSDTTDKDRNKAFILNLETVV